MSISNFYDDLGLANRSLKYLNDPVSVLNCPSGSIGID